MDIHRCIDLIHCHASIATRQADRLTYPVGFQSNRPSSALQRSSSCWSPVCICLQWWSIAYRSWPTNTTRKSLSSSARSQCYIRQNDLGRRRTIRLAWQTLREFLFRSLAFCNTFDSNSVSVTTFCLLQGFDSADRSHLWYTLPWAFNELVQMSVPEKYIDQVEVWQPPSSSAMLSSSRFVRMELICNEMSPILIRSPIFCPKNVEELRLFCCHRDIGLTLPSLRHLDVISSLDALHRCPSISMNIRSIIIGLQRHHIPYITGNWTALRSLRVLPHLRSLRVVLIDLHMSPDDPSCQIIAETAMSLVDFSLSFRRASEFHGLDTDSAFTRCCSFIEQLRRRIFDLSWDEKPECCVEKDGCGMTVWRKQRYPGPRQTRWCSRKQVSCIFLPYVWRLMTYVRVKLRALNWSHLDVRSREKTRLPDTDNECWRHLMKISHETKWSSSAWVAIFRWKMLHHCCSFDAKVTRNWKRYWRFHSG